MGKIYWTACNSGSFLNGRRSAKTMLGAVRAARHYLNNELYGDGTISYYDSSDKEFIFRKDEKSIFTGNKWVRTDY